ncbi:MAG: family 20 glycosylhydrolase [Bacteroidota bacterium]
MRYLLLSLLATFLLACGESDRPAPPAMPPLADLPIIPLPYEMASVDGYYYADGEGPWALPDTSSEAGRASTMAIAYLKAKGVPSLKFGVALDRTLTLPEGAYLLSIAPEGISIMATDEAGVLNGAITLEQVVAFSPNTERGLFLPCGTITDQPRFGYRSYMLDVARTFFGVDTVKQVIDRIAPYKINHLHLHLSDDQGWRIEIKSWPKLTEIGGQTEVDGTPGGYYTQEDYREIVEYAASRGITIVPEIDVPGHIHAALVAYPELSIDGKERELYTGTKVGFSTVDANKDVVYEWFDDVVREIAELTPGPYFHLGGDESAVTPHDDYVKFVRRAQQIIKDNGKQPMGWDEVAIAGLAEGAVAQLWNHVEYAEIARNNGNKVLISPATRTYLDMQYDTTSRIGLHWAAYIEVDSAYLWDPATFVPNVTDKDILGVESPLWGETIRNIEDIDYLTFPRLLAIAEVGWTAQSKRDYPDFLKRLAAHQRWLKEQGVGTYDTKVLH